MKKNAPITTASYDLCDHPIGRAGRQDMRFRYLPFGNFGGGPSLFNVVHLLLLHTFGALALRLSYALEGSRFFRWCWRHGRPRRSRPTSGPA